MRHTMVVILRTLLKLIRNQALIADKLSMVDDLRSFETMNNDVGEVLREMETEDD
jgi:hypothetical protein